MAKKKTHKDVEYMVNDETMRHPRAFDTFEAAAAYAVDEAARLGGGERVMLDVLVYSKAGAKFYGALAYGPDGAARAAREYDEDPDASVFERLELRVDFVGKVY